MMGWMLAVVGVVTNAVVDLPPVVVEASRLTCDAREIAAHVETLNKSDIESSGAQSTVELLEKRANLFIRKVNSNPAQAQVTMRGSGANGFGRVKILVDGEELNNPDMSAQNLLRVPLAAVQRVEILHGPQTVLHGSEASAGVINIVSDTDCYTRCSEAEVHGGSDGRIGAHIGTRGGVESEGLTFYADFDFDRADGWRQNSWYELWSVKGGLKQRFDNGSWWAFKTFYANTQFGLPGGLLTGIRRDPYGWFGGETDFGDWKPRARDAEDGSSHARNDVYGASASVQGVIDDENKVSASFSFRQRRSKSYGYLTADVYTFLFKLQYTNEARLGDFDNRLDLGMDLKQDLIEAKAYDSSSASGGDNDYTRFCGAAFAREEFWVWDELSVFGGARGEGFVSRDCYDLHPRTGHARATQGEVAGEAGVNWRPFEDLKLFAKWTRFYHAPLADEMFSAFGVPNMSLKPETGQNFEMGVDWEFGEDFNLAVTGYHTEMADEIIYLNSANCNAPDATARSGLDAALTWTQDRVGSVGVMYSSVFARFTEGDYKGKEIPLVPTQQFRFFGEYFLVDWLAVNGGFRFVGRQRYGGDFANVGGRIPAYGLFDCGFRLLPTWSWLEGVVLSFTVDNLFDRRYFDYGEYFNPWYVYPAAGRSFLFTLRVEF